MMAWMDRESKKIFAAFGEPQRPSLPTRPTEGAKSIILDMDEKRQNHEMEDEFVYRRADNEDSILKLTTLLDLESDDFNFDPPDQCPPEPCPLEGWSWPSGPEDNDYGNESDANECIESNATATQSEAKPTGLLPRMHEAYNTLAESSTVEEKSEEQTWRINSQGHLLTSAYLSLDLMTLEVAPFTSVTEESLPRAQIVGIARLVAENRQLEAFKQALRFASNDASTHTGINFTTEAGLYDCAPGISYPIIYILMDSPQYDTELQCYIAYYLLRGMLKRYGDLPFPDRVDIRETGFQRGRLLVPYGAGQAETGSQGKRVRGRIVNEMRLEKLSTRDRSQLL
ncbi:hypothetical protein E0Z10_g7846 [Xylaria hypoxylon]|uniref:Uncharacterized protein n=1 Tax=Xylaria hypoxylon TaxID=37992 RepID=A0A4Z0YLC2_9PEZI|nr:hypothetical protein E0Z10_g7846 [Xylaria hypoxylon]